MATTEPEPWQLDARDVEPAADVTLTHESLEISFLASSRGGSGYGEDTYGEAYGGVTPLDVAREYDRAGDIDATSGYAGRFRAIERSGRGTDTGAAAVVNPADRHSPPIDVEEWLISEYSETQVAPNLHRVTLGFQRQLNRAEVYSEYTPDGATGWGDLGWGDGGWGGLPRNSETWTFAFQHGALELGETAVGQLDRAGSSTGGGATLELLCDREQAAAIPDSAGYVAATHERAVPDGQDFAVDTSEGHQSVYLAPHSEFELAEGWYVVTDWTLELFAVGSDASEDRWRAVLDVLPADSQ